MKKGHLLVCLLLLSALFGGCATLIGKAKPKVDYQPGEYTFELIKQEPHRLYVKIWQATPPGRMLVASHDSEREALIVSPNPKTGEKKWVAFLDPAQVKISPLFDTLYFGGLKAWLIRPERLEELKEYFPVWPQEVM